MTRAQSGETARGGADQVVRGYENESAHEKCRVSEVGEFAEVRRRVGTGAAIDRILATDFYREPGGRWLDRSVTGMLTAILGAYA